MVRDRTYCQVDFRYSPPMKLSPVDREDVTSSVLIEMERMFGVLSERFRSTKTEKVLFLKEIEAGFKSSLGCTAEIRPERKRAIVGGRTSKCALIGGHSHGLKMEINDDVDSILVPVYWDVSGPTSFRYFDSYTRHMIVDVPKPGDRWIYFGYVGDNEVETKALAWLLRSKD